MSVARTAKAPMSVRRAIRGSDCAFELRIPGVSVPAPAIFSRFLPFSAIYRHLVAQSAKDAGMLWASRSHVNPCTRRVRGPRRELLAAPDQPRTLRRTRTRVLFGPVRLFRITVVPGGSTDSRSPLTRERHKTDLHPRGEPRGRADRRGLGDLGPGIPGRTAMSRQAKNLRYCRRASADSRKL